MEAKLIKDKHIDNFYYLMVGINTYATTHKESFRVLSLKNCQAIELGYDLDELAEEYAKQEFYDWGGEIYEQKFLDTKYVAFKDGFQKALDLNNTKLYTLEDMMNCWNKALKFQNHKETLGEYIQSLQQTEWDVEIVEEDSKVVESHVWDGSNDGELTWKKQPLFDADGCIILKRK